MDHDDRLSLAEKFAGSNSDYDEIDSDLEGKLYSAVFHSNEISSKNQDNIPEYRNTNSITDVINSWKNIPEKVVTQSKQNSDENVPDNNKVNERNAADISLDFITLDDISSYNDENVISGYGNLLDESRLLESYDKSIGDKICSANTKSREALADNEQEINIQNRKELAAVTETVQSKYMVQDSREHVLNNEIRSPRTKIMKKQKISPKKATSKDLRTDYSPVKSSGRNDTVNDAETCVGNNLHDDLAKISAPEIATESSDIKTEDELEENPEGIETERSVPYVVENCGVEEGLERPPSIKPEDESGTVQSMEPEVVNKELSEISDVKPEEEPTENIQSNENEDSTNFRNSLSSSSSSEDSSSSYSDQESQCDKSTDKSDRLSLPRNKFDDIITLDDSEDSIFEIPVPPKPRPPTINLEDSDSSTSSDSSTDSETMSPQKLVESYKMAVSKSNSKNQKGRRVAESTPVDKTSQNTGNRSSYSSTPGSDDSMTESEEENWGIIAGNEMSKNIPNQSSDRDEIIENFATEIEQEDNSCLIIENEDKNTNSVSGEKESPLWESTKKTSSNLSPELTSVREEQPETTEKESGPEFNNISEEDDTLIINAQSVPNLLNIVENLEPETSTRTSESRKRSITDSGKKSKHQNSPKKAKSSISDPGAGGSSSDKPQKENKENKNKHRNRAADYFFKPMTNEMENYYNNSWGGEDFDLDAIRRQMPRDPRHWAVLNEDLLGYHQRRSRYWTDSKCRNCNRTGHMMAECPEKKKVPCCHMCGLSGHREPRCPNKMCLGCGKKQKIYMQVCNGCRRARCAGCQSYGHVENNCPDLWRRYHLTTRFGDVNTHLSLTNVMKPQHMLSCCNCARRGHDSTTCENYRWSRHFPTPAYVTNYTTGPDYTEDPVLEDVGFPSDTLEELNEREKRSADSSVTDKASTSNEVKKRKSNAAKVTIEDPEVVEIIETTSESVDTNLDKLNEPSKSDRDNAEKSDELPLTNSESTTEDEKTLLILKSQLLDDECTRPSSMRIVVMPLSEKQYEALTEADLGGEFLKNLTKQFPIKLEIKRSENKDLALTISSAKNLQSPLQLTILDWLKWPVEERSRFVNFNLPKPKKDLRKLLSSKLNEINGDLGDPIKLYKTVQSLKADLRNFQRSSKGGKKSNSRRARVSEELAKSQCRLNMILHRQLKVKRYRKACSYLRGALQYMGSPESPSWVSSAMYLKVLHHYNILFAAYTPDDIQNLLDRYSQESNLTTRKELHINSIEPVKKRNKNRSINTSPSAGTNFSINTDNQISQQNINNDRGEGNSGIVLNFSDNYPNVQNQFIVPEGDSNFEFNFDLRPPNYPHPLMSSNSDVLRNNYHNSRRDFEGNLGNGNQGANISVQRNDDFIALENYSLQNNYYNVKRNFGNMDCDFNRRSRGRNVDRNAMGNFRMNEQIENGFANYQEMNNRSGNSSFVERNRWHDSFAPPHNLSSQDMFTTDTQGEPSHQNFYYNDRLNVSSRNEIERRGRYVNGPPISCPPPNNSGPSTEQQIISKKGKNKKKKKAKGISVPKLQKRAEKNIAKYINFGLPQISQAAKQLQKKLGNNDLTLKCVKKFEGLVKRKVKRNDHLL